LLDGTGKRRNLYGVSFLSPFKILQMADLNPAEFLGRTATMGSIDVGKNADIVLLNGNRVESVQNLHQIAGYSDHRIALRLIVLDGLARLSLN
jgi:imidazolonepropionase-like amidohydrolase